MGVDTCIKSIAIPAEQRKKTTLAKNLQYDRVDIYENRVVGYFDGQQTMTWFFRDYTGIDFIKANMNSQFAQVVFLTGINSKNRAIGPDLMATQNLNAIKDTNRLVFCSGMFSFNKTNDFASVVAADIRAAFENYKNRADEKEETPAVSAADELKKFKSLLDDGVISQEQFDAKKKQLLGI